MDVKWYVSIFLDFLTLFPIEDAAAYEKLGDGLRKFAIEMENLDKFIVSKLSHTPQSSLLEGGKS